MITKAHALCAVTDYGISGVTSVDYCAGINNITLLTLGYTKDSVVKRIGP